MNRIIISILLFILCACGGPSGRTGSADVAQTIHIATLKGPSAMGMIKMIDSLSYAPSDNDISIKIYTEPMLVRKAMLDGTADFAALPMNMAAVLYNKGLDYSLAAVPVSGSLYLAGSDTSITRWEDLRGRKVHIMAKGMTPDAIFRYLLVQNGLTPDEDVILDYNFPTHTDMASALASGRATLGVISEPYISMVMTKNSLVHPIIDLNREWAKIHGYNITETAFLVKTELIESQSERVQAVLDGYAASISWVNHNQDSAAALMVKFQIISDTSAARISIPQSHLIFRRARNHKDEINAYLRTLFEMSPGLIGGKLPDEAFYQ